MATTVSIVRYQMLGATTEQAVTFPNPMIDVAMQNVGTGDVKMRTVTGQGASNYFTITSGTAQAMNASTLSGQTFYFSGATTAYMEFRFTLGGGN